MANQRRNVRGRRDDSGIIRILRFAAIPFIVIILIIIIMCMDQNDGSQKDNNISSPVAAQDGQSLPEAGAENSGGFGEGEALSDQIPAGDEGPGDQSGQEGNQELAEGKGEGSDGASEDQFVTEDPSSYAFQQDAVLELTGLVQAYCEAKEECDPELLAWVFGIDSWSEEQKNEERAHMELVKASVKGYQNISCYSIQGPEKDSYVIFPYYEIRYRETETLMPAFSWGYARKDESGRYYMVQDIDDRVSSYIRKAGEKPEVKAVMAQILSRQQEAMAADEVLQKIYGTTGDSEVIIGGVGG